MTTIFKKLSLILYHPFLTNQVALPLERSHTDALPKTKFINIEIFGEGWSSPYAYHISNANGLSSEGKGSTSF